LIAIVTGYAWRHRARYSRIEIVAASAFLFEDRQTPGDWHVQWTDDDGGFEMAIFSGPRARERAIMFAEHGSYAELRSNEG
jgi:hypothetical protein